jgi:uncharacterized membrane protein
MSEGMPESPPAETPAGAPEEVEGARGPADLADLVFIALGNEPFWNVRVFTDRLRYEALGGRPVVFESPGSVSEPGSGKWGWTAEAGAQAISVAIEERPCNDTMSDVCYQYAASVRFGERSLVGCAMKGGAAEPD